MTAKTEIVLTPGDYELGMLDCDGEDPEMLCCVSAEGSTPYEFFGGAIVQGTDRDGDVHRDWWVAKKTCPFRDQAIELLMEEWAKVNGLITRFEVETILAEHLASWKSPFVQTYKTMRDHTK